MPKINQEEYEVLLSLDERAKSIVRQDGGRLWVAEQPIMKDDLGWYVEDGFDVELEDDERHLFQFIQWENEEPHNIAELIEEYEDSKEYKDSLVIEYFMDKAKESEETEVKNIEWLKEELTEILLTSKKDGTNYFYYRDLKEKIYNAINQLDEPEVLSEEWIDEHKEQEEMYGTYGVPVRKLQNLLVPKQELIEENKRLNKLLIEKQDEEQIETVASVMADFFEASGRLKEVLTMEVEELEE